MLAVLLLGSVAAISSQRVSEEKSAQPGTTFRVGTKLVEVDVVARDKHGLATGLSREDFTLLDNGSPQEIAFFLVKSVRDQATAAPAPAVPLPPGTFSNRRNPEEEAPATQTVLLIDQIFTNELDQIFAVQRIAKFLDLRRKQDGIGIYTAGNPVHVIQDVTDDEQLLRCAANRLQARDPNHRNGDTTGMSEKASAEYLQLIMKERIYALKHAFEAVARHLASVPGRKNLVWITDGFPLLVCVNHICIDYSPEMRDAARALNEANIALYAVDARGLIGALGPMMSIPRAESRGPQSLLQLSQMMRARAEAPAGPTHIETMNLLAGLTGGAVYFNSNGLEDSFKRAVEDGDITYSLGFYPSGSGQDETAHRLVVKVDRMGVRLRYRENYFAAKPRLEADDGPALDQLLRDPLNATQIGLLAQVTPAAGQAGVFDVHVSLGLHDLRLDHQDMRWVGAVQVSFLIEGTKTAAVTTKRIEIPENQLAVALENGVSFDHLVAWQGRPADLRIVVEDKATGAAGSVIVPLGRKRAPNPGKGDTCVSTSESTSTFWSRGFIHK